MKQNRKSIQKKKIGVPHVSSERVVYDEQQGRPPSTKAKRDHSATIPDTLKDKNDKTLLRLLIFRS